MATRFLLATTFAVILLASGCAQQREYGDPEECLKAFVNVLQLGDERRYDDFFLNPDDVDLSKPGAEGFKDRLEGGARGGFWKSCRQAHDMLKGQEAKIAGVELNIGKEHAPKFMREVEGHHANVVVRLLVEEKKINLVIAEMVKVRGGWRLGKFTIVDIGETKKLPDQEITISTDDDEDEEKQD